MKNKIIALLYSMMLLGNALFPNEKTYNPLTRTILVFAKRPELSLEAFKKQLTDISKRDCKLPKESGALQTAIKEDLSVDFIEALLEMNVNTTSKAFVIFPGDKVEYLTPRETVAALLNHLRIAYIQMTGDTETTRPFDLLFPAAKKIIERARRLNEIYALLIKKESQTSPLSQATRASEASPIASLE